MPRARNIKPGFYKNEDLAECSVWARLLFPGLWMLADREGRLEDRPKRIKGEIFPFDSVEVDPLLDELVRWGLILRYEVEGKRFIQIINFAKHQKPHVREKDSIIPPPNGFLSPEHEYADNDENEHEHNLGNAKAQPRQCSARPDSLNPDSLNPDSLNPESEIKQGSDKSSLISPNQGADARDEKPPKDEQKTPRNGNRCGELARLLISKGVAVTSQNPDLIVWVSEGLTDAESLDCVARARLHKPEPERIPAKYLNPIVRQVIAERNRPTKVPTGPPRYGGKTEAIRQRNETNVNAWLGEDDQAIDGEFHAVQ